MNYLVRKNILENETGEWQNKSNLKSEFIKEASSFSVKQENVFTLCEKSIQENHGEKTALLKVQDMLDDFKFEVLRRMAGDRKVFELQSEKTEYEARIEHAEGKISGEQLQQKINVLEKEQETKIVKHERDKATIEKLETKDVFLSNNSHESNDYLGAIAINEKTKYFENKDLAEILASEISQSKQKLTGLKQHKRNEVADCNKKLNELNNVSQKNQKMMQEMSNTPNTPNALDKVRGQTITDAVIVDKIKKLVKEFMRTENFEIIKTDTLEEMYAKATAVDITREEVENRKDKAKKVLVETGTIRRKKRQDRGSVLEQNQDQMNVSERVAAFEKNGESKPDQTVSVKTPNKNGSNLSKGNKQQTNNSFNRSEDDLREQVKPEPEPKSINRLSNSNLSKENEQQTNHSLDESEVGLRKQAKPEIQATNSLANSVSEKDSANNRPVPVPVHVKNLIHKFNNIEEKDSLVLRKGPKANFIHGLSQQEERRPNRIARSRSVSHTLHEVHREQTDKGRRNSAPELTTPSDKRTTSISQKIQEFEYATSLRELWKIPPSNLKRSNSERVLSSLSTTQDLKTHDKLVRRDSAPGVMTEQAIPSHSFDQFDRILIPRVKLRYVNGQVSLPRKFTNQTAELNKFPELSSFTNRVLTLGDSLDQSPASNLRRSNSERVLSSLSTTQDLKTHDKLVRRNSAPGVMTEQSIPSHSFDQFDRILIPRVKLRYVNGQVSLSKEFTNQTAELNKFPELSSFTNQVLTPGDSLDQPSTPNSDSEINNLTNQVPLPKDSSDLRSVSEGDMNQTSMPENVNSTLDETDSVKKSVSVEDLKLAYVERLRSQVAFVEQKIKHDEELKKYGPYNNFFLDQSKKSKAARSKIEIDLTKNKTLCEGLKTILGDEKKLAEFLEEIQPKDPQVLAKELENVKQDTAELKGKAEELKEITYKDLKKKWYQVLTRPSFYLFLARQVLWVAPMAFFSAMAGALPLMPTGTQILHGSAVVNWLRGVIIGSYVGQRLVNAVPKIIPRTSKRVQRFAKERFPKTVAALEKGSKTIARPFKSIGKSVRSTARTIGRPLKPVGKVVARPYKFGKEKLSNLNAKTFVPIGKKIKETFDIAHSEKRSSEENQNLKKGLDANGQRLPFATRVKNAALMTTTNFAKRLWRNKVKTLIGVALFVGLATFGLPLLLTAALPAISGTLIASVAAIAVPALFTLLGVWVADKYLLKPLQNRLANRENAKREQLFTERSAKVQELGQHHSLTPDFNTRVARVAQIDNEKQTAEKQKTQTSQKTKEQELNRTSISSISTLNKQTETDKVRLRDSVSRVLNNPTNAKQSSGRASVSSKNDHQRSEGYGR
ncbi:hypothetical protein EA74_02644 [Enterococcus hirae]|uniref:hypothetical protein n=1 Tax=Enterococcus hirae TaxID=1354 RepID=UPI000DFC9478|nr:hypothetical protein [Enterococcus hirae]RBT47468.1 hypothetical protein EA74_02644 [Enterococcus hirae]RBT69908.1 hypothetical protein EA82_01032 [Enterococcus hirae]